MVFLHLPIIGFYKWRRSGLSELGVFRYPTDKTGQHYPQKNHAAASP
jgi:hypothetical protein